MTERDVIIVRHAATSWSSAGRHTSHTDIELDAAGRVQAAQLPRILPPGPYGRVLCSPRRRAVETCELAGFGDRAELTEDLAEWEYGDIEGLTTAEVRAIEPGWSLFADGPPGGERLRHVAARVDRVIDVLRDASGPSLLFSHGHVVRVLGARWVGLAPDAGRLLALDAASVSVLGYERETPVLRCWNVVAPVAA